MKAPAVAEVKKIAEPKRFHIIVAEDHELCEKILSLLNHPLNIQKFLSKEVWDQPIIPPGFEEFSLPDWQEASRAEFEREVSKTARAAKGMRRGMKNTTKKYKIEKATYDRDNYLTEETIYRTVVRFLPSGLEMRAVADRHALQYMQDSGAGLGSVFFYQGVTYSTYASRELSSINVSKPQGYSRYSGKYYFTYKTISTERLCNFNYQ